MKLIEANNDMLKFDDGSVVTDFHDQDCCESVYAHFAALEDKVGQEFPSLEIEGVPDAGFRIGGEFVPCYNRQNGYYSANLSLIVTSPDGTETKRDISAFVEDEID